MEFYEIKVIYLLLVSNKMNSNQLWLSFLSVFLYVSFIYHTFALETHRGTIIWKHYPYQHHRSAHSK